MMRGFGEGISEYRERVRGLPGCECFERDSAECAAVKDAMREECERKGRIVTEV